MFPKIFRKLITVVFGALLLGGCANGTQIQPLTTDVPLELDRVDDLFTLEASNQTADEIDPDTSFKLKSAVVLTTERVKEVLQFTPHIAYAVEAVGDNEFEIKPDTLLPGGEVLSAAIVFRTQNEDGQTDTQKYSWAYQVQEKFQVVSTLPRDKASRVAVDTGIEIEFSHGDLEELSGAFTISPQVDGRFEYHRKTAVFVPNEFLAPETLYTITIAQSYQLSSGKQLQEDYIFQFETDSSDDGRGSEPGITQVGQVTNETSTEDPAYFIVSGVSLDEVQNVNMRIYELDPTTYQKAFGEYHAIPRWCYYLPDNWSIDTADLSLYAEEQVELQDVGGRYQYAISTPGALDAGQYYVEIDGQPGKTVAALLQVSNINAYFTTSKTDTVAWIHDALTDEPLADAAISILDGDQLGTTNSEGILQVTTPEVLEDTTKNHVITIEHQGKQLFIPLAGNAYSDFERYNYGSENSSSDDFWSYIYLDQPFYKPGDTMQYWGVLDPRDGYAHGNVTFSIYQGSPYAQKLVLTKDVEFGTFNTYEGAVTLSGMQPGDYYAVIKNDDEIAFERYFSILTYTKPAYTIAVTPEVVGVMSGDEFTHDISATFFDDTPVANTDFTIDEETYRTNEAGKIMYTRQYQADDCGGRSYYCYESVNVSPTFGEEGKISGFGQVHIFKASRLIDAKLEHSTEGWALLNGTVYLPDLAGYNNGQYEDNQQPNGASIPNAEIEIVVTRKWSTQEQNGTRYDFMQKRTIPKYNYTRHTEEITHNTTHTAQNGSFTQDINLPEPDSWYDVTVSATDEIGRKISYSYGISGKDYSAEYQFDNFFLEFAEVAGEAGGSVQQFSVGDTVTADMYYGDKPLASGKQSFLFIQAQNGIREIDLRDEARYKFTFEEKNIPNVNLQGIWYDGRSYWSTSTATGAFSSGLVASFDEADRKMNITTTLDKDTYQPGDEVIMDVQVSQPDGSASASVVNVNLIDEAIYAILPTGGMGWAANYQANFASVLYSNVVSGIYAAYASHRYPLAISGAEGGGGWGTRTDFPDQAFYKTVVTDETGHTQLSFTLPDSITSWRVNVHAIDGERYASNDFSNLIVTQPFFVTTVLNDEYLVGDQPIMKVRAFGDAVQTETPVTVTVSSNSLGMEVQQFTVQGNQSANVPLPIITEGTHSIEVTAESGEYGDTIVQKFTGRNSFMAIGRIEEYAVEVGWQPPKADASYTVVFADRYKAQAYQRLNNYRYNYGDRGDQQAARVIATQLLNEHFEMGLAEPTFVPSQYQLTDTGGAAILPYGEADLTVSAHLATSRLGEEFDQLSLQQYFYGVLNDGTQTSLRHAQALYGLAGLQQPILLDTQNMARRDDITDTDRLYIAAALAQLGDFSGAQNLYTKVLNEYGEQVEEYWYLTLGVDQHEQLENTILASYVATILQLPEADALYSYVQRNRPPEIVLDLIAVNIIEQRLEQLPEVGSVITYRRGDEEYQYIFEAGKSLQLVLLPNDQFEVTELVGDVRAVVSYEAQPTDEELNTSESMSIERRYEMTTFNEDVLVKVYVDTGLNEGLPDYDQRYQVTDIIPAGMRLVTSLGDHGDFQNNSNLKRPYHIDGQRVSFYVSKNDTSFEYYLRPIQKGTFIAEPPVIQSYYFPHLSSAGRKETIVIE